MTVVEDRNHLWFGHFSRTHFTTKLILRNVTGGKIKRRLKKLRALKRRKSRSKPNQSAKLAQCHNGSEVKFWVYLEGKNIRTAFKTTIFSGLKFPALFSVLNRWEKVREISKPGKNRGLESCSNIFIPLYWNVLNRWFGYDFFWFVKWIWTVLSLSSLTWILKVLKNWKINAAISHVKSTKLVSLTMTRAFAMLNIEVTVMMIFG